jgi:hypothetical protein
MTVTHPFDRIPPGRLRVYFVPVLGVTVAVGVALLLLDPGGKGIVGLEVAGSVEEARRVMAVWTDRDRIHAAFGTGLDYLFLLAYANAIALACIWGRRVFRRAWLVTLGGLLAWGAWLAGALDMVENIAMLDMIRGPITSPAPQVAAACAYPKFVLVYAGLIYGVAAGLARLARRAP